MEAFIANFSIGVAVGIRVDIVIGFVLQRSDSDPDLMKTTVVATARGGGRIDSASTRGLS